MVTASKVLIPVEIEIDTTVIDLFDPDVIFAHHPPTKPGVIANHEHVRDTLAHAARRLMAVTPPDAPETSHALRALQTAMHWANSAIAQHQWDGRTDLAITFDVDEADE